MDDHYQWGRWKPGQKEELARLYAEGMHIDDLAMRFHRSKSNIRTVLHNVKASNRQNRCGPAERKKIFRLIDKGWEDWKIAKKLKRCRSTIQRIRLAAGMRKYKYSDAGLDGWPVGLKPVAILALAQIETAGYLTLAELRDKLPPEHGAREINGAVSRLVEKRHVVKRTRKHDAVFSLAGRVRNMRNDWRNGFMKPVEEAANE